MQRARWSGVWSLLTVGWLAWAGLPTDASGREASADSGDVNLVRRYNTGFHFSVVPGVIIPTSGGGNVGFSLALQGRYGLDLGSVIVAPGARLAAYFRDGNIYMAMPTLRITAPLGSFAPYLEGAVGVAYLSQTRTTGVTLSAGAGFMLFVGTKFGFGVGAEYQKITGTDFSAIAVGPSLFFTF